jgi:hypothetical protein
VVSVSETPLGNTGAFTGADLPLPEAEAAWLLAVWLALSARSLGATLYTRNRDDFTLIQSRRSFLLVVIS